MMASNTTIAVVALLCSAAAIAGVGVYAFYGYAQSSADVEYTQVDSIDGFTITYVSGTENAYTLYSNSYGEYTVIFDLLSADSEYTISGTLKGNIVAGGNCALVLDLAGVTVSSNYQTPIDYTGGASLTLVSSDGTSNSVSGFRLAADGAYVVNSVSDLYVSGTGSLMVTSSHNSGIKAGGAVYMDCTKLEVHSEGNCVCAAGDVSVSAGTYILGSDSASGIVSTGTSSTVSIDDSTDTCSVEIFAGASGIDSAGSVSISESTGTSVSIKTSDMSSRSDRSKVYIGYSMLSYTFSLKTVDAEGNVTWVNPVGDPTYVQRALAKEYVYVFEVPDDTVSFEIFAYDAGMVQGQDSDYLAKSASIKSGFDRNSYLITQLAKGMEIRYAKADYGGPASPERSDSSTVGIRAGDTIDISGGDIVIRSQGNALVSGTVATLSGGTITAFSRDAAVYGTDVVISGGDIVLFADGQNCSPVQYVNSCTYTGGRVAAMCTASSAGLEAMQSISGYSESGSYAEVTASRGQYVEVTVSETVVCAFAVLDNRGAPPEGEPPMGGDSPDDQQNQGNGNPGEGSGGAPPGGSGSYYVFYLGSNAATFEVVDSTSCEVDENGVYWS